MSGKFTGLSEVQWELLRVLLPPEPERRKRGLPHADFRGVLDLLHNSRFELEVVNASDQVEAQAEAFAAISIALRNNFKAFESTDDVFV